MSCQSLRISFIHRSRNQFLPQSHDSCLQFRSPLSQPSPPLYSSRYLRQCLPYDIVDALFNPSPSSYLRFPHISVGNFQLLSPRLRQCTLVPRSHLLLILLGSLSVPSSFPFPSRPLCRLDAIHLSQCRLLCPCVPSADVCVTVLDISVISSFSLSAVFPLHLFNTYVKSMLSMQFYSFFIPSSLLSPSLQPFILSSSGFLR